jgi:hypothetical protein
MEACLGKMESMDLEPDAEEIESKAEHEKALRKRPQWKLLEH